MSARDVARRETVVDLWDSLDVDNWGSVAGMTVTRINPSDVHEFARRWHYSNTGGSAQWSYGLWDGLTLAGVVSYNLPTMETCASVFGSERWRWVAHMGRLVCAEDAPRNVESRLIAGSLHQLPADRPGTRAVLTYAAQDVGHIGYVYQATNAIYTGATESTHNYYVDQRGQRRSDYFGGRYVSKDDAAARGWTQHVGQPKHRYLYLIGTRSQRREAQKLCLLSSLPYPKQEKAS